MQKLIDTLRGFGIEIPEDKTADVKKALSESYKHIGEFTKATQKLEGDRDGWKKRAETAEKALKGFDGIDPADIKSQLEEAQRKVKEAQDDADKRIAERDFNDALKAELESLKFTSAAARRSVEKDIRDAGLKLKDGKILGLSDLIEQIKGADSSAFVDEAQAAAEANKARFTQPMNHAASGKTMTRDEIMSVRDTVQRQRLIGENRHLFMKGKTE